MEKSSFYLYQNGGFSRYIISRVWFYEQLGKAEMLEDKRLIWRVKGGDEDALRQIYEKYKGDLLSIAASLLNEAETAEDILHDVFVTFAEGVRGFELYGSLKNYLITCVVNRVRDRFREKMYQVVELERAGAIRSDSEGPDKSAIDSEESQLLTKSLTRIPLLQREAIILHLQGGLKFREIANIQGVSINTVQGRYRYGLSKLRSLLDGEVKE